MIKGGVFNMKCNYCGDPVHTFQESITEVDQEGKGKEYHKDCYVVLKAKERDG